MAIVGRAAVPVWGQGACESDKGETVVTGPVRAKGGSLRLCPLGMGCSQTPV